MPSGDAGRRGKYEHDGMDGQRHGMRADCVMLTGSHTCGHASVPPSPCILAPSPSASIRLCSLRGEPETCRDHAAGVLYTASR